MAVHIVKTWRAVFQDVWDKRKPFEVRRDDRGYAVGDVLIQREFNAGELTFTGRYVRGRITYKLGGGQFGIEPGYCVLALDTLNNFFEDQHPLADI